MSKSWNRSPLYTLNTTAAFLEKLKFMAHEWLAVFMAGELPGDNDATTSLLYQIRSQSHVRMTRFKIKAINYYLCKNLASNSYNIGRNF